MQKIVKIVAFGGGIALFAGFLGGCSPQSAMHPYAKTNHLRTQNTYKINHNLPYYNARYGNIGQKMGGPSRKYANRYNQLRGRKTGADQQRAPLPGPLDMFQRWIDYEPQYTLYPGDQIDVVVQTAPELSRTLTVGPDGRISMPMTDPIMVAGRPLPYVKKALQAELGKQLRDSTLAVTTRAFAPQQIYVGGEVGQQGTYTLSGPIGSLEAVIMAGGFLPSAKTKEVAILRRAPNGNLMIRTINHKGGMRNIRSYADNMQLRRGDIIFVPRSNIAEIGLFMQQYFRDALPFQPTLSYNIGNQINGN
ncbi:MAG: polysaccharide biosynthesis/export family protein [Robiginitomaculum sp.]